MSKAITDENYYNDIVDELNIASNENIQNAPNEIAPRIANLNIGVPYNGVISTKWEEDPTTGAMTQKVSIPRMKAKFNAVLGNRYDGDGSPESYDKYINETNQFLDYITNGYAKTYDSGIQFFVFGEVPTIEIPFVVEVL